MVADCGTIEVVEAFDDADVQTVGCSSLPSSATVGDTVNLDYTVENNNPKSASVDVEVIRDGEESTGSDTLQVGANDTATGSFDVEFGSAGAFYLTVQVTGVTQLTGR